MGLNSLFDEELEVLKSIYMDDLIIVDFTSRKVKLKITIHPNTAENVAEKFVCLTLEFTILSEYPHKEPFISIRNPRGLSDAYLESIGENLKQLSYKRRGEAMLYEIIEYVKESLSDNNHPCCICPICLDQFKHDFVRLDCYHYLHKTCFNLYISSNEQKICPVCRIPFDLDYFQDVPNGLEEDISVTDVTLSLCKEYIDRQKENLELYHKQKLKGGIIDVEWEKNKHLISLNAPPEPLYSIKESIGVSSTESLKPLNAPTESFQRLEPCSYKNQTRSSKSSFNNKQTDEMSRNPTSSRKEYRLKHKMDSKVTHSKHTESLTKIKARDLQFFPSKSNEAKLSCIEVKPDKNTEVVSNKTDYEKKKAFCNEECKLNNSSEPQRHLESTVAKDSVQINSKVKITKFPVRTLHPPPGFEKISPKNLTDIK